MKPATRSRIWSELKPFLGPAIFVVIYAIVRVVHGAVSSSDGIVSPSGMDGKHAALVLLTLAMRTIVLVIVPGVVVFRLVMRLLRSWFVPDPP